MPDEERNVGKDENTSKMKELAEILNVLLKKIEIAKIPDEDTDAFDDEDYDDLDPDGEEYDNDLLCDMLYDVFEKLEGNIPMQYVGPDIRAGLLGLITLHNEAIVKLLTTLLLQMQLLQAQLLENDKEKIELMKKQNQLLEELLKKR